MNGRFPPRPINWPQRLTMADVLAALAAVLVLSLALTLSKASAAEQIVGRATVIDGDTIEIRGERIRLCSSTLPNRSLGFVECEPYNQYPDRMMPLMVFMELSLQPTKRQR